MTVFYGNVYDKGWAANSRFSIDKPIQCICASGLCGTSLGNIMVISDGVKRKRVEQPADGKPKYCIPTMKEIAALPWNGINVVSTFSGCGGSSLGYKMAGCKVLWASEFIPKAQACYSANHPGTILDTRDIRTVTGEEVLQAIGMKSGELDILDGSPPCASFSTLGKKNKGWGKKNPYSDSFQRTDDLFWEYARILRELQPKAFIAENVKGLTMGKAKGYYLEILSLLRDCGYEVECRVLDARWMGVPQSRNRAIFIGMRSDLKRKPLHPKPFPYEYSMRDATPDIGLPEEVDGKPFNREFTIAELKRYASYPDDFVFSGSYAEQWERIGRSVPPLMMKCIAACVVDQIKEAGHG